MPSVPILNGTLHPPIFLQGFHAYFLILGKNCAYMYIGVRSLQLLRSRCKNPHAPKHILGEKLCYICILKFMIMLALCFTMGKTHRWGTLLNLSSTVLHITYDDQIIVSF
jgi:hypothetical protein